jgi:prevent-host-death family protein
MEVRMKSFAFSDLNRQPGEVLDAALAAPVTLTRHGKPKIVMLSVEEFERLTYPRAYTLDNAPAEAREALKAGLDELLARR